MDIELNVPAILAATIAAFVIGGLWYSPLLFQKRWMANHGYTAETLEAMKRRRSPALSMVLTAVCHLVTAFVMAFLIGLAGVAGLIPGLTMGLLAWLGFAAPAGLMMNLFSDKPLSAFLVDTGYHLVYLAVMGVILGAWQ